MKLPVPAVSYTHLPQAELLQLVDQVAVDLQEVTRQRFALEQVAGLRFHALVATGDGRDGRGRGDGDQQGVAQAMLLDPLAQAVPALSLIHI